jgi:serine/threonine protein kinase
VAVAVEVLRRRIRPRVRPRRACIQVCISYIPCFCSPLLQHFLILCPPPTESGLDLILAYANRCSGQSSAAAPDWNSRQAALAPTLIPDLRFHDLVFGASLGTGAFSTVKYARHIQPNLTRSDWPEYAVKIISIGRIVELRYVGSVKREVAVLQELCHPGIARLVSAFRYPNKRKSLEGEDKDGAKESRDLGAIYLVLEYAAKGDLHTFVINNGALSYKSTQFVIGEVISALIHVHDCGFVYNDLKPENLVITQMGHIKLTDFGACRPAGSKGRRLLASSRHLLDSLRSGDWRHEDPVKEPSLGATDADGNDITADERVEGTPRYVALTL